MKKFILLFIVFVILISVNVSTFAFRFPVDFPHFTDEETVYLNFNIWSPEDPRDVAQPEVYNYFPGIDFEGRFILNRNWRMVLQSSVNVEATFGKATEDSNYRGEKVQQTLYNFSQLDTKLDIYLGWRINPNIHFAWTFGGGTNFDKYRIFIDQEEDYTVKEKAGYGAIRVGAAVRLNEGMFFKKILWLFVEQRFEFWFGDGSLGIENWAPGNSLVNWFEFYSWKPTSINDYSHVRESRYPFYAYRYKGKVGAAIPLHKQINWLRMLDRVEFKPNLDYEICFRTYPEYTHSFQSVNSKGQEIYKQEEFKVKTQLDHLKIGFWTILFWNPIPAIEWWLHYYPMFWMSYTNWEETYTVDDDPLKERYPGETLTTDIHDYFFSIQNEFAASLLVKIHDYNPKVPLAIKLETKYVLTQNIGYQKVIWGGDKVHDKGDVSEWIGSAGGVGAGGRGMKHTLLSGILDQIFEFWIYLLSDPNTDSEVVLKIRWKPSWQHTYSVTNEADTGIWNLGNWLMAVEVKFDPKKMDIEGYYF